MGFVLPQKCLSKEIIQKDCSGLFLPIPMREFDPKKGKIKKKNRIQLSHFGLAKGKHAGN
jgi:hypothetical protein